MLFHAKYINLDSSLDRHLTSHVATSGFSMLSVRIHQLYRESRAEKCLVRHPQVPPSSAEEPNAEVTAEGYIGSINLLHSFILLRPMKRV